MQANQGVLAGSVEYCLYARKSTEQDERQALSIDSQIKEMMSLAERENLTIKEIRRESHSAKNSGCRPVYNELILDVRSGKFSGILTWAPDRLSRNAGDLGAIVDLMDQGHLKEIRTHGQRFTNSPNEKFLLMILCSQAKLENDNRGINVKRGQKTKVEMGMRPCMAPLGYLQIMDGRSRRSKTIVDSERAPIIKDIFEYVAYGHASGRDILKWINNNTNFKTRKNKPVALSMVYNMLRNPFYYGEFEYPKNSGKWYHGLHEPLITKELFDKAQEKLDQAPTAKSWNAKVFDYTKLFQCGVCGSGVTAQEKFKKIKDGSMRRYVYYNCTGGLNRECKQPYIREEELQSQLLELIDQVNLDQMGIQQKVIEEVERYKKLLHGVFGQKDQLIKMYEVDPKAYAKHILREGTKDEKREILSCFKDQIYLKDKKIYLSKK